MRLTMSITFRDPMRRLALILSALAMTATTGQAGENLTLSAALDDIAKNVAGVVKEQGAKEIVVNPITDTGDLTHTAGPGLTEALIAKLRTEGVEAALKADLVFSGEYGLGEAERDGERQGFAVGRLAFKVKRRNGKTLVDSEKDLSSDRQPRVTNPADLAKMGDLTVFRPPTASAAENDRKVLDAIDNKNGLFEVEGTKIRPKGAPYAIEMLVAPASGAKVPRQASFRPRAVVIREGMPFLKVEPGEAVAVRIINEAGHDAASTVTVDGLSMFTFRDDKADKNDNVIIRAGTAGDILGWFRNAKTSSAFLVADFPQDHPKSGLLKNPAKIGAFTVTFAAAWEKDNQRPPDEPPPPQTRQATEIVLGAPIEAPYESVKRQIGVFRAAVTVRYDKL
jgi:hypothetical protein